MTSNRPFDRVTLQGSDADETLDRAKVVSERARAEELALFGEELKLVHERRERLGIGGDGAPPPSSQGALDGGVNAAAPGNNDAEPPPRMRRSEASAETVGLALSGGGIRSATISLGILRALCRAGLLPRVDYLSTVSGGSYTGAFLCSRFVPIEWRGDVETGVKTPPIGGMGDPFAGEEGQRAFDHLRQSGRHLLPGSAGDAVRLVVLTVRSWLAVQTVIGLTLLTALMLLKVPQALLLRLPREEQIEAGLAARGMPPLLWPSEWLRGFPVGRWYVASWLFPVAAACMFVTLAMFLGYFLTRGPTSRYSGRWFRLATGPVGFALLFAVAGLALAWFTSGGNAPNVAGSVIGIGVAAVAILASALCALAALAAAHATKRQSPGDTALYPAPSPRSPRGEEDRGRYRLTNWATRSLAVCLTVAALALFDSAAETIYVHRDEFSPSIGIGGLIAAIVPVARQVFLKIGSPSSKTKTLSIVIARLGNLLALAVALVLALAIGILWAVAAQFLTWWGQPVGSLDAWSSSSSAAVLIETAVLVLVSGGIGICFSFLNLSTFAAFYASRLRRAYLGATNFRRWTDLPTTADGDDHVDDDVALDRYYDRALLSPIHLINVTINDTASRSSSTTQRDRRGKPLVLSPFGFLYPESGFGSPLRVLPFNGRSTPGGGIPVQPEKLPLSTWIGISGAAASTGLGQYGSLGLSLLAGLSNVRLGYWWDPGSARGAQDRGWWRGSVQGRLTNELMGRFPGTDGSRWYLTDGGHFENTGVYELVRRRVGFIVLCDNGADPKYDFADLVTLMRRIRIDFDAQLTFIDDPIELDTLLGVGTPARQAFGGLHELASPAGTDKRIGPYALGRIHYSSESPPGLTDRTDCTLLLIKPRVCGREAADLLAYARTNPPFPQQSTLDQFFNEAQWESYYRLGEIMGERLFSTTGAEPWCPARMRPAS